MVSFGLKAIICTITLVCPAVALAGNFATCLLDKLPAVQNDIAANAAFQACTGTFPGGFASVPQGAGRGWFSPASADCTLKKAGDTRSNRAAVLIGMACRRLYDEPPKPQDLFDELGINPNQPARR